MVSWAHEFTPHPHLDRFGRFDTALACDHQNHTQTDHAASVAVDRISCIALRSG